MTKVTGRGVGRGNRYPDYQPIGYGKGHWRQEDEKGRLRCSVGGEWKAPEEYPPDKRQRFGRASCCRNHKNLNTAKRRRMGKIKKKPTPSSRG